MPDQQKRFEDTLNKVQKVLPFALIAFIVIIVWIPFDLNITPTGEMWFQRNETESFSGIIESLERQNDRVFWFWSVVLGDWLTPNTYIGHQIVFMLVYILRGSLTYLILLKLFPKHPKWAITVSLLSLFNPADPSGLFWLGALHVHAHDALFLLPIYLFLLIWDRPTWWKWGVLIFFQNIVLWSYEGTLLLNLAVPALLFYLEKTWRLSKQAIKMTLLWYISPMISVIIRLIMYISATQAHFVRKADQSFQISEIFDGLGQAFLRLFIGWFDKIHWLFQKDIIYIYAGLVFIICLIYLLSSQRDEGKELEMSGSDVGFLFLFGIALIILGFLPYALTEKLRYRYDRTLIIPWIGAAIIFTTILWQFSKIEKRGYITFLLSSWFIALTVFLGLYLHRKVITQSQAQDAILAQIVEALPQIEKGTAISLIYDHDCLAGEIGKEYCVATSSTFKYDKTFTGSLQFIYDDASLTGLIHQYSIKGDTYRRAFKNNRQWPLDKLIIIRYSPQRDKIIIENEVPPGLIQSPDLSADGYAPNFLYDDTSRAPYRACLIFTEFFLDESSCLAAP